MFEATLTAQIRKIPTYLRRSFRVSRKYVRISAYLRESTQDSDKNYNMLADFKEKRGEICRTRDFGNKWEIWRRKRKSRKDTPKRIYWTHQLWFPTTLLGGIQEGRLTIHTLTWTPTSRDHQRRENTLDIMIGREKRTEQRLLLHGFKDKSSYQRKKIDSQLVHKLRSCGSKKNLSI